jgi:hypothetical protein
MKVSVHLISIVLGAAAAVSVWAWRLEKPWRWHGYDAGSLFGSAIPDHAAGGLRAESCELLPPTAGAVLYWPNKHNADEAMQAPPSSYNVSDVWSTFLCTTRRRVAQRGRRDAAADATPALDECAGCEGVLRLTRTIGCSTAINPSRMAYDDPATAAAAEALGPDDISVWLEGAELLSPLGVHTGNCMYDFSFRVTIPGVYRVVAVVTRSDWDALDETSYTTKYPPCECRAVILWFPQRRWPPS